MLRKHMTTSLDAELQKKIKLILNVLITIGLMLAAMPVVGSVLG